MLGISIYLGNEPIKEQVPYIRKMREHGFQCIFTSLHIPEDDQTMHGAQIEALGKVAVELAVELMADISPHSLDSLGLDWKTADQLLDWGLSGLRIDYGIDEEIIIDLSHKMRIALNASTITSDELIRLKAKGLHMKNVEAWHNYYPRPRTGLGSSDFIQKNNELKETGITVMAFIPGDDQLRGPLYEKLPTLEKHRTYSPFAAYLDLLVAEVDKIVVGDIGMSEESLEQFQAYKNKQFILRGTPSAEADENLVKTASESFTNRADPARDVIRAVESRSYAQYGNVIVQPKHTVERPAGTVTIDNERYRRYQGEIQITLTDLPADERVNVLGRVVPEDFPILQWIKANQKFKLKWLS